LLLLCAGCTSAGVDGEKDENLKSGEVTQLAFTSDGKNLVVINEVRFNGAKREECHSRLRSFSTSDWRAIGDTKELSLIDLSCAASPGQSWVIQAHDFDRFGRGKPNYRAGLLQTRRFNVGTKAG
jgi:hypothetical protein